MNTCPRITGTEYENANSSPILNFVFQTPKLDLSDIYRDSQSCHYLHRNNVKFFKERWGRQSCCWVGEYRFWIWKHEFEHCDLYVLSAPQSGSSYEVSITGDPSLAMAEVQHFIRAIINDSMQ